MANTTTVTNQAINEASAHVLPGCMSWVIDMALLPLLLLAEGYLMGSLFARGWVNDIEAPSRWGLYHTLGVLVFYAAGAATAGLGLRASVGFAASLRLKRWGFAFLNLLTVVGLSVAELWSSFSERSFHLAPSPADRAVLTWLHQPADAGITPTLVVVSLVLPFASLTYGFSQQHKAQQRLGVQETAMQTAEDKDEEEEEEKAVPAPAVPASKVRRLPTARGASLWGKQRQASVSPVAAEEAGSDPLAQARPVPSS
jgi:uncharacterized membrane protein